MSSGGGEHDFWKKLWKFKVPPKVRNFWWRVIKGYIPCRAVLKARHIERLDRCLACGEIESIHHALFECTWAKLFWQEIRDVLSVKVPALHPSSWAIDIIDSKKVDPKVAAVILCGGWAVWAERNARDHGESTRLIAQSVKWTTDITRDLAESKSVRVKTIVHPKRRPKWTLPAEGVIKINVDASFDLNKGEGSSGLVARNHEGVLLRGHANWYSHGANSLTIEALAVRDGVKLANDLGLTRIKVETDASEVVKLWNERR
jgi:hypothetical protein